MKSGGISVRIQLVIVTLLLVILPVGIAGTVLYLKVSEEIDGYILSSLRDQAKIVEGVIEREFEDLLQESDEATKYGRYLFGERVEVKINPEQTIEVHGSNVPDDFMIPTIRTNGHPAGARVPLLANTEEHLGVRLSLYYVKSDGTAVRIHGGNTSRSGAYELTTGGLLEKGGEIASSLENNGGWKGVLSTEEGDFLTQVVRVRALRDGGFLALEVQNSVASHKKKVSDFLSNLSIGENGYVFVLDREGRYVLSEDRERDGEKIIDATDASGGYFIRDMVESAPKLGEDENDVLRYPWRNAEDEPLRDKVAVYSYFEAWEWVWGVSAVWQDYAGGIAAIRTVSILVVGIFVILAVGAAFLVGSIFSRPISRIEEVMRKAADGDLSQKVALKTSVKELKTLSEDLDERLFVSMREMLGRIKDVTHYSHETGEKISNQVEGTLVFTNQMTQKIMEMRKQIHGLDGQINEASSAVEEIQATIANVGKQIDQQSSSVSETSSYIEEMNSSIQSVAKIAKEKEQATQTLLDITGQGGEKVRQTNDIIQEIGVSINDMLDMITIINKVAAQTNMLAMNAAIEAAHAGEAGRGFAVVAEEIRNLSTSTGESAKKISDRLKEIVGRIQDATEMSTETGTAFEKIEGEVKEFVSAFQEIASSTSELSTGSEEMLNAVNSLQDVAQEIQDGSEEMKKGSQDINESLQSLTEYSGNTVDRLKELVEKTSNVNYAQSNMIDLVIDNNESAEKLAKEVSRFRIDEEEKEEQGKLTYSQLVRFSGGALIMQEWIAKLRNVINEGDSNKSIPRLENGRLQQWIDGEARDLVGEEEEFKSFLSNYDKLVNLTTELEKARKAGDEDRVEEIYFQIVDVLVKAKGSLHSMRYSLSD